MTRRALSSADGTRAGEPSQIAAALLYDVAVQWAEWDELAQATGASPFARPGWVDAWVAAFSDRRNLVLATASENSRLAATIPLLARRATLCTPANWHTPEAATVATSPQALAAAVGAALATRPRRIVFRFVAEPVASTIRRALANAGYRRVERTLQVSPYARLDRSVDRDPPAGGDLGRKWRRLSELGEIALDVRDGRTALERLLEEGFRVEGSGWKHAAGTAIVSQARTQRFYTDVAAWAAAAGLLSLAFLRLDGRPLAFQFGLRTRSHYYFLKGGYDPGYRRYSPGRLLHARMLAAAATEGIAQYEFLGGDEEYKRMWSYDARPLLEISGYRPSLAGTADLAATGYLPRLLRRLRSGLRRLDFGNRSRSERRLG